MGYSTTIACPPSIYKNQRNIRKDIEIWKLKVESYKVERKDIES
jgi:hypothetical protein